MKILLLEDELMLQSSIFEYLETLGFNVTCFSDGLKALENLSIHNYDLLILDINVPNLNGLELMRSIYDNHTFTPTIFISADTSIDTISSAFELGAIEYLKKPFHLKELGIRIKKEILQLELNKNINIQLSKNYSFSKEKDALYFNKEIQKLTNKKLQIIKYLALNIGIVITIDTLREYIWNNEPVSDGTIRTEVSRLKKVLKEDFIENIKGIGYTINKYLPKV